MENNMNTKFSLMSRKEFILFNAIIVIGMFTGIFLVHTLYNIKVNHILCLPGEIEFALKNGILYGGLCVVINEITRIVIRGRMEREAR